MSIPAEPLVVVIWRVKSSVVLPIFEIVIGTHVIPSLTVKVELVSWTVTTAEEEMNAHQLITSVK